MTPTESATLARYLRAHFPQQPIDEYTADALHELLAPYPPTDCRAAVLAIAERGEKWCSPTDVKAEVKRIRSKRIRLAGDLTPPPGLEESEERAWLATARRQIGDGRRAPEVDYGELKPRHLPDLRQLMPKIADGAPTRAMRPSGAVRGEVLTEDDRSTQEANL